MSRRPSLFARIVLVGALLAVTSFVAMQVINSIFDVRTSEPELQTSYDTKQVPYYPDMGKRIKVDCDWKNPELLTCKSNNIKQVTKDKPRKQRVASQMRFQAGDIITHTRRYKKATVKRCTPYYCDVYLGKTEQRWFNDRIAERHVR